MNIMNRRNFLKINAGLGLGVSFGLLSPFKNVLANGSISSKKIIILNLAGGNDTANAFPPYTEQNYYDIRPTLAIPQNDVFDLNGTLGMHPSLSALQDIWTSGDMALFPAAHCGPSPNRSHFYQYDFYAKGDHTQTSFNDGKGFLARFIDAKHASSSGVEAFDFYGRFKVFNSSNIPSLIIPNPNSISFGSSDLSLSNSVVEQIKEFNNSYNSSGVLGDYKTTQDILFDRITTLENIDFSASPQNSAAYPNSTLGRQMRQAVVMLRNLPELDVVHIARSGWDTHANQGGVSGNHASLLADIGNSIRAAYDDLGTEKDNVLTLVPTEFSRTAHENGSKGTDHGHAAAWFAIGGAVKNQFMDTWPGFKTSDLANGRYTAEATDYRDIYAEAFKWAGLSESDAASCFPEYTYHQTGSAQSGYLNHS